MATAFNQENLSVCHIKNRCIVRFMMAFVSVVLMTSHAYGEPTVIGRIAAIKGEVLITRDAHTISAERDSEIFLHDSVRTREAARVKIRFIDDSALTLSQNSHLDIKEYFYDKVENGGSSLFELLDGQLRTLVGKAKKLKIHTPTAVAAARGTFFFVRVKQVDNLTITQVFLLEGTLAVKNSNNKIPGEIILEAGMTTTVTMDEPPSPPRPITEAEFKELINCSVTSLGRHDGLQQEL